MYILTGDHTYRTYPVLVQAPWKQFSVWCAWVCGCKSTVLLPERWYRPVDRGVPCFNETSFSLFYGRRPLQFFVGSVYLGTASVRCNFCLSGILVIFICLRPRVTSLAIVIYISGKRIGSPCYAGPSVAACECEAWVTHDTCSYNLRWWQATCKVLDHRLYGRWKRSSLEERQERG